MKIIHSILLLLLILGSSAFADDMLNSGGIFNKGLYVCNGSGASCVKAKQVNNVGGITDNGDGSVQLLGGGSGSGNVGIGTVNFVPVYVGISTLGPSAIVSINGNVGIGTVNPTGLFEVAGSTSKVTVTSTGNFGIGDNSPDGQFEIVPGGAYTPFIVSSVASADGDLFRIHSNGNVSVGAAADPSQKFGVTSSAVRDGIKVTSSASGGGSWLWNVAATGTSYLSAGQMAFYDITNDRQAFVIDNNGNIGVGAASGTNGPKSPTASLDIALNGSTDYFHASSSATGNGDKFMIKSTGNVGIGSLVPGATLDVNGSIRTTSAGTAALPSIIAGTNGNGEFVPATNTLAWSTNALERGRIDSAGNFGINTVTAGNRLTILGNIGVGTVSGSNFLSVAAPNGGAVFEGNIGLGTFLPAYALDVQLDANFGTINTGNLVYDADAGVQKLAIMPTTTAASAGAVNSTSINIGGTDVFTVYGEADGNAGAQNPRVGIGTTLPQNSLSILGNVGIGTIAGSSYVLTAAPLGGAIIEKNVGIGTTIPTNMLEIAGAGTSASPIRLVAAAAKTSPDNGAIWNDSTQNMIAFFNGNTLFQSGNLYTATANVSIGTTAPTSALSGTKIGTTTIKANSAKVGHKFQIWGAGNYTTPIGNTSTVTITAKIGSTTISTVTTGALPSAAANLPFDFMLQCTVQTAGASGKIVCNGAFNYSTALSAVAKTSNDLSTTAQVSVDFTADQALDVQASWSAVTTQSAVIQQSKIDFL